MLIRYIKYYIPRLLRINNDRIQNTCTQPHSYAERMFRLSVSERQRSCFTCTNTYIFYCVLAVLAVHYECIHTHTGSVIHTQAHAHQQTHLHDKQVVIQRTHASTHSLYNDWDRAWIGYRGRVGLVRRGNLGEGFSE